jgi:hypothetical protein
VLSYRSGIEAIELCVSVHHMLAPAIQMELLDLPLAAEENSGVPAATGCHELTGDALPEPCQHRKTGVSACLSLVLETPDVSPSPKEKTWEVGAEIQSVS